MVDPYPGDGARVDPGVPGPVPPGPPGSVTAQGPLGAPPREPGSVTAQGPLGAPPREPGGTPPPVPPAGHRPDRARAPMLRALLTVAVAALVGAGSALAVARVTGWGRSTVVQERGSGGADVPRALDRILPSVVAVTATVTAVTPTTPRLRTATTMGTGIVVSERGEVVTNDHVVSGASSVEVSLDGSSEPLPATVVGESPANDLALLRIGASVDLTPARFSTSLRVGDGVLAIGYALGLSGGPSVTDGIVSATGRTVVTGSGSATRVVLRDMIQTDAAISSGNSGGPLVDLHGRVLGINTVVAASDSTTTAEDVGFAIPAATVLRVVAELRG